RFAELVDCLCGSTEQRGERCGGKAGSGDLDEATAAYVGYVSGHCGFLGYWCKANIAQNRFWQVSHLYDTAVHTPLQGMLPMQQRPSLVIRRILDYPVLMWLRSRDGPNFHQSGVDAMKLVTFSSNNGSQRAGALVDEGKKVLDLQAAHE